MNRPPSWLTEGAHPVRRAQIERDYAHRERRTGGRVLPRVPIPVDVSDAARFPNIAEASEWARNQEQLQREWEMGND